MGQSLFRPLSIAVLTIGMSAAQSAAHAQDLAQDTTAASSTLPAPPSAPPPSTVSSPEPLQSPSDTVPAPEVSDAETTMDRVDRDRWVFPNRPLVITGSAVLISSYVPAVVAAAVSDDISNKGYYPVAGPWMEIAQESNSETWTALLAIDGVFQGLGALALVSGFVIPERKTRNWYLLGKNDVFVSPHVAKSGVGIGAFGRF